MPIQFTCPHCRVKAEVADEYVGQSGPCAACGGTITVAPAAGAPGYATPAKRTQAPAVAIILSLAVVLGGLLVGGGTLFWLVAVGSSSGPAGESPLRAMCAGNLRRIGLGMQRYHQRHGCFPPAYLTDRSGRPMHSWRVLLLPHLDEQAVYDRYNFDQPWDSPSNRALADLINPVFRCRADRQGQPSETSYVMIVGPGTISEGATATRVADIKDGTSRTIMVVEASDSGIHWMEPRDLRADRISFGISDGTLEGVRSNHRRGAHVLFCDGSVRYLDDKTDPLRLKAMTSVAGGEGAD